MSANSSELISILCISAAFGRTKSVQSYIQQVEVGKQKAKREAAAERRRDPIKQALNESGTNDLDTQLDLERDLQRQAGRTADYREGVAAFMEKRSPKFSGQ